MGETFGHVVPGVFYCVIALVLLFLTRQNRDDPKLALTGSRDMRGNFGWSCAIIAGTGFFIEGIGGVLHNGDFFFQLAHETMYMAFIAVGLIALAESRGRLPNDSWRLATAIAFFVEGLVFYGHSLEQKGTEQMLHHILVIFSWFTTGSYLLACLYRKNLVFHVMGGAGMLTKGVWFFVIANILYSGDFGEEGEDLMIATGYTVAGVIIVILFSIVGCCVFGRSAGAYDDFDDDEVANALEIEPKKYAKVVAGPDA